MPEDLSSSSLLCPNCKYPQPFRKASSKVQFSTVIYTIKLTILHRTHHSLWGRVFNLRKDYLVNLHFDVCCTWCSSTYQKWLWFMDTDSPRLSAFYSGPADLLCQSKVRGDLAQIDRWTLIAGATESWYCHHTLLPAQSVQHTTLSSYKSRAISPKPSIA